MGLQDKGCVVRRPRGRPSSKELVGADILLQTARGIFARRGFDAATLRAIALASGTDPALVSHHFGCKEALWIAVVDQIAEQVAPLITLVTGLRARAELRPGGRVEHALRALVRQNIVNPDIGMFFATAATEDDCRIAILTERLSRPFHEAFTPLLEDAMRVGDIPVQDPHILYSMLVQGILQTISYSHLLRPYSTLPDEPEAFEAAVFRTVLLLVGLTPIDNKRVA